MARTDTLGNFLTDVADAIREKKGTTDTIQASNFDTEIASIEGGGKYTPRYISFYSYDGTELNEEFNNLDTSRVTDFSYMFDTCNSLTEIPQLDTSNGTKFYYTIRCPKLISLCELNYEKATDIRHMIVCSKLENFGGFKDLGKAYSTSQSANYSYYKLDLSYCTALTHDSLMNVINKLYDIATKGCNTQALVLGSTNLAKLTEEEIAIATNKGWTVS